MNILGISAFYHDSAACLVQDGRIVAAAQEERFTRKKHDESFPTNAIAYCLKEAGIRIEDLDHVAFYDKPLLTFERLLETWVSYAPRGFHMFAKALPVWLQDKLHLPRALDKGLNKAFKGRYIFTEHHQSHAASAFFPSPFEEAAVLTLDGVGEWATGSIAHGEGNRLRILRELRFPHSLGLLYSAFTYFCGFKVNSGEYKLMGLAPYGEPRYTETIERELMDLREDGSFRLNMRYFGYGFKDRMITKAFDGLFGGPARRPETPITEREMDLAASIQKVTEKIMLRIARTAQSLTGSKNLCLAGGVALNCVGNGKILREGPFENLWIQPAAGDAGGALGAATFVWHQLLGKPRTVQSPDAQSASLLGPRFDSQSVRETLDACGAVYRHIPDESAVQEEIARLIANECVVGHFHGRMEFGPRALGNRSIIGDARSPKMQSVMNLKIKFRESFRPFAPCVLKEHVHEIFEMRKNEDSPYMLLVAPVKKELQKPVDQSLTGLDQLKALRSDWPAITHVDYSARVQTVDPVRHPRLHGVMKAFHRLTGSPVIINTSFNVRGEPVVCTPKDAWHCFLATDMDALVLEDCILLKEDQPKMERAAVERYLSEFALD